MLRYTRFRPEKRTTLRGFPFTVYKEEPLMPRIDDRYLDCSAYLYPSQLDAERGERIGGTGFMAAVPACGDGWLLDEPCPIRPSRHRFYHHYYIVSNRHVAEKHPVVRLNTHDGLADVLPLSQDDWVFSQEHDLAAVPVEYNRAYKYLFISTSAFLDKTIAADEDIGIGDEVFMVGRFVGHDGKQRNSPSVRWGHVSTMLDEPLHHPSNPSQLQESFLVEVYSISGYSGSPVFVRPFSTEKLWIGTTFNRVISGLTRAFWHPPGSPHSQGPWLLGVEWGFINSHDQRANNTGVSAVVPAWFLLDLLNTRRFKDLRVEEQQRIVDRARKSGTALT